MIEFENIMYNVTINDDGFFPETSIPNWGGGEGSKIISLVDICEQFNLTEDEDANR